MTEQSEPKSITIPMDRPTQLFYKGVSAAGKVSESFEGFPKPATADAVNAWWFYVGIIAGKEHGIHEEDDVVAFLRGAKLNAPHVPTEAELEEQYEDNAIDTIIDEIKAAFSTAVAAYFTVTQYDNGWFYCEDPQVQLTDGTVHDWEESGKPELDGENPATLSRIYEPSQYGGMVLKIEDGETIQHPTEWPLEALLPATATSA
jgi:hypothetical protein